MSTMTIAPRAMSSAMTSSPRAQGQVRLTRRGRLVVFLGALLVVLLLGVYWGAGSVATEHRGTPESTQVVMVGEGETLWDIAADVATDGETGAMVERIQRLNALDSGMLTAGQKIRVPTTE
jgi:hypothetical protein